MSDTQELADRGDRERAEADLDRSFMVEAAAGTGKTTLLVSRILRLIKERKARPEEIVAITFTERAAAELKAKLQERLGEEAAQSSGQEAHRLAEALWGIDRMQVTTIHAFCTSILKERPVEAGIDPNFAVADELATSLLSQETWNEWLAREMNRGNQVLARALGIGIKLENMHQLALAVSINRDVLGYLPRGQSRDARVAAFVQHFGTEVAELEEAARHCDDPQDKLLTVTKNLKKHARELGSIESEDSREAYVFKRIRIRSTRNIGRAANWTSKDHLKEVRERIGALRERHGQVKSSIAHDVIASLAGELLIFVANYTRAKASQGLLDFHDLLLYARDLLKGHPHVRDYFRRRFRYILVDEFQDTDPLQAEIIFYLAGEAPGGSTTWQKVEVTPGRLFLVGDPKQSIYRFRRADIEMYASAKGLLGSDCALSIHQNFRCADSIVDVVNRVFEDLIRLPEDGNYQPDYVALDFGRSRDSLPERRGAVLLYPPDSFSGSLDTAEGRRTCESRSIAAFIRRVTGDNNWCIWDKSEQRLRPIMLRDIAILMRTQTGLDILERALRLYGIDYRVIGGRRFFACEEIQHLLAVLMSIDNPNDKVSLVAALRSPFFGISDEEIFLYHAGGGVLSYLAGAKGSPLEPAFRLLRSLHGIRNKVNAVALLNTLYEETKAPVIFLLRPNGEQRIANLLKIGDIARALADRGVLTFRGFVRWLGERKDEEAYEAEAATVEAGDDFVRLLTIHKAKGLEFPVVILTDLAGKPNKRETFIIDRRHQEIAIRLGKKELTIQTANFDHLSDYEELRREAEERRMLYVAMTRARDLLVLPVYFTKGEAPSGSLLEYLVPAIPTPGSKTPRTEINGMHVYETSELEFDRPDQPPFRVPIDPDAPESPQAGAAHRRFKAWKDKRAEGTMRFNRGRSLRTATEEKEILLGKGPTGGALFGKIVHSILEHMDWAQPGPIDEIASQRALLFGGGAELADQAAQMIRRTLESDLVRRLLSSDRYYKEVPFAFRQNGTIVEGVIDVLFEEEDRIGIIDFKTDRVSGDQLTERVEAYRPQVETYRRAVTLACGKPPEEVILFFLHPMKAIPVAP